MMVTEERRVQKKTSKKKGSKTSKPTNQPTISAAPTVSAAPTSAKSAKKNAAKSKKTTPVPCDETVCFTQCLGGTGVNTACMESPPDTIGVCGACIYQGGESTPCSCTPPVDASTTDLKTTSTKKGSKTSKPTNQPTISAAPTVSAAPTSAKSAKKNAAKSKKTNTAPTPVPCSENFCINDCVDGEGTCYESTEPLIIGACSVCYAQGEGLDCSCNPPTTTDLFN